MVELAIVLPLVLVVLMAVIDFGRILHSYTVVVNSAREAAMVGASANTSDTELRQVVLDEVARGNAAGGATTTTFSYAMQGVPPRRTLTVDVTHQVGLTIPLLTNSSVTVRTRAVMLTIW